MLPVYQEFANRPGNLDLIARFFVPKNWAEHSWREAARIVAMQLAALPSALLVALRLRAPGTDPRWPAGIATGMSLLLVWLVTSRERLVSLLARAALVEIAVAVFATRAIRGNIEPYLVLWISVVGVSAAIAVAAWLSRFRSVGYAAAIVLILAVTARVPRGPIMPAPDAEAERVSNAVATYVEQMHVEQPTVRIASLDTWPLAAATILSLTKRGVPLSVEKDWLYMFGASFAEPPGPHPSIVFEDSGPALPASAEAGLVARTAAVTVYRQDP